MKRFLLAALALLLAPQASADVIGVHGCLRNNGLEESPSQLLSFDWEKPSLSSSSSSSSVSFSLSKEQYVQSEEISVAFDVNTEDFEPCHDDFVGLFLPSSDKLGPCEYMDFQGVFYDFGYRFSTQEGEKRSPKEGEKAGATASFSQKWKMNNIRQDAEFRYYSKSPSCSSSSPSYSLRGSSKKVSPKNLNEPTQIHLSLTNKTDQMLVSFTTFDAKSAFVRYGKHPKELKAWVEGNTTSYGADKLCSAKANIESGGHFIAVGQFHFILLDFLQPRTRYYYVVGTKEGGESDVKSFLSAPSLPSSAEEKIRFVALADMGVSHIQPGVKDTLKYLHKYSPSLDFVIHAGDLSYGRGVGYLWEQWMNEIGEAAAASVPYLVGVGNHEYDHRKDKDGRDPSGKENFRPDWGDYGADSNGECGVPTFYRFRMPELRAEKKKAELQASASSSSSFPPSFALAAASSRSESSNSVFWYSFDYGPVHFVMFSSEHNFTTGSAQYRFLKEDLSSVDRKRTPWLITAHHRPFYNSAVSSSHDYIQQHLQKDLEPLFHAYGVDVNLFGHYHAYERTCAVYKNECVEGGTTHLLMGNAGQNKSVTLHRDPSWSMYRDENYGFTIFEVNATHLDYKYIHNADGEVADKFTLSKKK